MLTDTIFTAAGLKVFAIIQLFAFLGGSSGAFLGALIAKKLGF